MKLKKLLFISLLLLAILTLGAVSAAQSTDELAAEDIGDDTLMESPEENVEMTTEDNTPVSESPELEIEVQDKAKWGEKIEVNASVSKLEEGTYASVYVYDSYYEEDYDCITGTYMYEENTTSFTMRLTGYGTHALEFKLKTDDGKFETSVYKTITVEGYDIYTYFEDDCYTDKDAWVNIRIPSCLTEDVKITLNNKHVYYNYYDKEDNTRMDDFFIIKAEDLEYGTNNLTIEYPGDDNGNGPATFYETFECHARIIIPEKVQYKDEKNITLTLPSDATGKLIIKIDWVEQSPVEMKDGKATFTLPTSHLGDHYIEAEYINDTKYHVDSSGMYYTVVPKITVPSHININGGYITFEIPESFSGIACAYLSYYDYEIEEYIVTNLTSTNLTNGTAKIFIKLDENEWVYVKAICNDTEFENEIYVRITSENPDWNMEISTHDIINSERQSPIYIENPVDADESQYVLKVDGQIMECEVSGNNAYINASGLSLGNHSFELAFLGDGYFQPVNRTGSFIVDIIAVEIKDEDNMDSPDSINVFAPANVNGTLTVKVDGEIVFNETVCPEDNYDYIPIYIEEYTYGTHTINIRYTGSKGIVEKTYQLNATYDLSSDDIAKYGGDVMNIYIPSEITSGITVKIDGIEQNVIFKESEDYRHFILNTPKDLEVGNHTITITYKGDKKYPARTVDATFEVIPYIEFDGGTLKKGDGISLIMPEDAKGNLTVEIRRNTEKNFTQFANIKAAGEVFVTFDDVAYGNYYFRTSYTGDDYKVLKGYDAENGRFTINPEIKYPSIITIGDSASVSVNLPGVKGILNVYYGDEDIYIELKDGKASVPLKGLELGNNPISITLETNPDEEGDYLETYYDHPVIKVYNPIVAKDAKPLYSANGKYTVNIKDANGNPVKSGKVTFYIMDGKKQLVKKTVDVKNGAATLTYKITQGVKTYTIKTVFNKAQVTKKLTVKHVVTLKTATVKKSGKKLTLQATLSKVNGKYLSKKQVTFKFNGKTYKAKTNSKGVAKVIIKSNVLKKLKVGKKITYQATYLKDTVKKTAKVKK